MTDHMDYMGLALELAAKGRGYTSPNPMVGAVLVKDGKIVGRGFHRRVGAPHAEVEAIADAGAKARGATLYVTLEPCNHQGRTPPCTEAVLAAGIARVVVAMEDPNPNVAGGGIERLQQAGIEVICGVCREKARRLNQAFVKYVLTGRPLVILKAAMTMDGRIATSTGDSRWVTGEKARDMVHRLRHAVDAIMVGIGTVRADDPSLTARLKEGQGSDPVRIILDTRLSIDSKAKVMNQDSEAATWIVCGNGVDEARLNKLGQKGVECLVVKEQDGRIDLDALLVELGRRQITSLLVEGGATVGGQVLARRLADKVIFFYAPKIMTGDDGVPLCRGRGPRKMADCLVIEDMKVSLVGGDIMVEGYLTGREI